MKTQKIITKETLQQMLLNATKPKKSQIIGRALVVLFKNQTEAEQSENTTKEFNGIGFAGCDAYSGSLTAKYYLKHNTLEDWQLEKWGTKILKYHRQLNDAAIIKANSNK